MHLINEWIWRNIEHLASSNIRFPLYRVRRFPWIRCRDCQLIQRQSRKSYRYRSWGPIPPSPQIVILSIESAIALDMILLGTIELLARSRSALNFWANAFARSFVSFWWLFCRSKYCLSISCSDLCNSSTLIARDWIAPLSMSINDIHFKIALVWIIYYRSIQI